MPETCLPRLRSSDGDQGTSWKPRPSSIMAKRPDASINALTIEAGDILTARRLPERHSHLSRELLAHGIEFTLPQRVDQVASEDDLLPLPASETLLDQMLGPAFHRGAHLGAEPAVSEGVLHRAR